ncbi:MAG: hypothetical protein JW941_12270 [Candidatus Coatesbacteria bacterium]|nr:hypothetical protein [Candidatus Coatesbacteria bacterium]
MKKQMGRRKIRLNTFKHVSLLILIGAFAALLFSDIGYTCEKEALSACRTAWLNSQRLGSRSSPPSGVTVQTGFPIVTSDVHCAAGVMYDLDGDGNHEAIFGTAMSPRTGNLHWAFDAVWATKGDGKCPDGWPITVPSHVCSGPAVGNITGTSDVEVVFGSNQDPGDTAYKPDHKVYAAANDGSTISGFPVSLSKGKAMAIPTLANLDQDGALEILIGTAGYYVDTGSIRTRYEGRIVGIDGDGSILSAWNITATNASIMCSAAIGDLYESNGSYSGHEVVFLVTRFDNPTGLETAPTLWQEIWIYDSSGNRIINYDIGNENDSKVDGFGVASPAIGQIFSYGNNDIKSNLVVLTENKTVSGTQDGEIQIYHIAPTGSTIELVLDWSTEATVQTVDTFKASPAIADIDNDGDNEVVAYTKKGTLYVADPSGGTINLYGTQLVTGAWTSYPCSDMKVPGPILINVGTDSTLEIILATLPATLGGTSYIKVIEYDGSSWPAFSTAFSIELDAYPVATICAGDMDSDSKVEVIAQAYNVGGLVWCYEFDDSTYSSTCWPCECGDPQRTGCAD